MSIERVKAFFGALGMEQRVWEFETSSATVEMAAETLGVRPARIAKTLSFALGEGCVLVVAAGDARVDNKKFKEQFLCKARMLAFEEVERLTGSEVGGVCPFALPEHTPVYLDISLKRFLTYFPPAAARTSAMSSVATNSIATAVLRHGWTFARTGKKGTTRESTIRPAPTFLCRATRSSRCVFNPRTCG
jgi:prolyl-tRNA editing enzyme YbaK/EbsC (Cys-tRNA(Pro) deacylase)